MQHYFFHATKKAFSRAACCLLLMNSSLSSVAQAAIPVVSDGDNVEKQVSSITSTAGIDETDQVDGGSVRENSTPQSLSVPPQEREITDGSGSEFVTSSVEDDMSSISELRENTETLETDGSGRNESLPIETEGNTSEKSCGDEVECPSDLPCTEQDPDPDADGLCNSVDQCDNQPGPATNNGCPPSGDETCDPRVYVSCETLEGDADGDGQLDPL